MMQDLIAGRIEYGCPLAAVAVPQIEGKTVKAIAILAQKRSPIFPNLASADEQGLSNFDVSTWYGIFLPKGTPAPILKKLHNAILVTMGTPAVQERLKEVGADLVEPKRRSPDYLAKFVVSEIERWAVAMKAANIKPQ